VLAATSPCGGGESLGYLTHREKGYALGGFVTVGRATRSAKVAKNALDTRPPRDARFADRD
jgi:hypothetical protein